MQLHMTVFGPALELHVNAPKLNTVFKCRNRKEYKAALSKIEEIASLSKFTVTHSSSIDFPEESTSSKQLIKLCKEISQ